MTTETQLSLKKEIDLPANHLVFVVSGLGRGGAETQAVMIATFLRQIGWKVTIVSLLDRNHFEQTLEALQINYYSIGASRGGLGGLAVFRTAKLLRRLNPDILLTMMFHGNIVGRIAGRLARVPLIISSIRNEFFGGKHRDLLERLSCGLAHIVTTNSRIAANGLISRRVVPQTKLVVIPNAIELPSSLLSKEDAVVLRTSLGIDHDEFLWLAVGNLTKQKNYIALLEAMRYLVDEGIPCKLRIAGQGPIRDEVARKIFECRVEDHVELLGQRTDVKELMEVADGFVLTSAWEGSPNVLLEAFSVRLPVVATNVGGVSELIPPQYHEEFLVPPCNLDAIVVAMKRLMQFPIEQRKRYGERGREYIESRHGIDAVMSEWLALFIRKLNAKR